MTHQQKSMNMPNYGSLKPFVLSLSKHEWRDGQS